MGHNGIHENVRTLSAAFLEKLGNVKEVSPGRYMACCPSHDDKNPSLAISEVENKLLIHCWSGCRTSDILTAIGLDYQSLFLESGTTKGPRNASGPRRPETLPFFRWNWRSQCGELEQLIQAKREHAEAFLSATQGLDVNALTATEFDEVMDHVGSAYNWLDRCERLDETVYLVQQDLRAEEQAKRVKGRKPKVAA